jgi:hypothetical protein
VNVFVPAHGFSKRVERKHTRPFAGKSLVEWTVIQCLASKHVDTCYVSTNDDEVAAQVERAGGAVLWRNYQETPDDSAAIPLYHGIKDNPGLFEPAFINLFVTSPLREPNLIDRVVDAWYIAGEPDALQAIGKQEETTLVMKTGAGYVMTFIDKRGPWTNFTHVTQVLRADYFMNDYAAQVERGTAMDSAWNALKTDDMKTENVVVRPFIEVPWWQCIEPDTPEDFKVCECLMENLILGGAGTEVYEEYARSWS